MIEKQVAISEGQHLTLVKMRHNAKLASWDQEYVLIRLREGEEQELQIEESEMGPAVSAQQNCDVWVPAGIPVKVRSALGNLAVTGLQDLDIERRKAELQLRDDVAALAIGAAEKLIGERLDDEKHRQLIQEYIDQLGEQPHA